MKVKEIAKADIPMGYAELKNLRGVGGDSEMQIPKDYPDIRNIPQVNDMGSMKSKDIGSLLTAGLVNEGKEILAEKQEK